MFKAGFVRGIERIGGFGGKADALAECTVYTGDPGCFRDQLARIAAATPAAVTATANKWLRTGDHILTISPGRGRRTGRGAVAVGRQAERVAGAPIRSSPPSPPTWIAAAACR